MFQVPVPALCPHTVSERTSAVDRHTLRVRKGRAVAEDEVDAAVILAVVADAVVVGHAVDNGIPAAFQSGLITDDPCGGDRLFFTVQVDISHLDNARDFLERFC